MPSRGAKRLANSDRAGSWRAPAIMSLLATVFSWRPYAWRSVSGALDPSWQSGLAEAFTRHVQWGPSLVFTFGPYGIVDNILPFYRLTAFLAVLFALAISWGLAALVVSALRPSWGLLPAGVMAWAVLAFANNKTGYADIGGAVCLGLALTVLYGSGTVGPGKERWAHLAVLGALSGFLLLTKFNDGLLGLGLAAAVVLFGGLPRVRALWYAGMPLVAVLLVAWVAASQSLGNLWSYAKGSLSEALGYSAAMGLGTGRRAEGYFGIVVIALLAAVFVFNRSRRPLAVAVVLAGWTWVTAKEGFVRHDTHDLTFFGLMLAAIAFARLGRARLPLQAAALVAVLVLDGVASGAAPQQLHSPGASTAALVDDLGAVVGLGGFSSAQHQLRAQLIKGGSILPARILTALGGHTVAIEPVDAAVGYVYPELKWDTEPVLQGYSAYTTYLDQLNAGFLASTRAPQWILFQPYATIDGRDPWFDPPATVEAMDCHYVQVASFEEAGTASQLLGRASGAGGRCGRPVLVERVRAHFGSVIDVPEVPGDLVTATFGFGAPLGQTLRSVLLKPLEVHITVWAPGQGPRSYRFIPGTASDPHVVSAPAALGYSAPFVPPPVSKLELSGDGWPNGQGALTVEFYALTMRPL